MVLSINGKDVKTMDELVEDLESKPVGQSVELDLIKDGKRRTVKVLLSEMPAGQ